MSLPLVDGPQAETRVLRTIVIVLGIATLVMLSLVAGTISAQAAYLDPLWLVVAVSAVFGTPPLIALASPLLDRRAFRYLLSGYAVVFTLAVITFIPAMTVSPMPLSLSPWPLGLTALGSVAAALVWRPLPSWIYLALNALVITPVRELASGGASLQIALQDSLFSFSFSAIFTALAIVSVRNARAADTAAATAREVAARAAAGEARAREQLRLDALVHDQIMSTLLYASQYSAELAAPLRRQAAAAIHELQRLSDITNTHPQPVPVDEFTSRLRSEVTSAANDAAFTIEGWRSSPVAGDVASALAEATGEAMRNSVLHAGRPGEISRSVTVVFSGKGILVQIADDGVGFSPHNVAPHRLGIAVSVQGRLANVDGGSAVIESQPGKGTVVTLRWKSP